MTSARDEIWIDMMQFDAGNADGLWEGGAPPPDAPSWYGDVSGLIRTSTGPAEPHELVDEPVVVEDMQLTAVGRPRAPRRQHHRAGRTVRRMIALKAAAATTVSVFGVAAAAAATTGIVATVAKVVVPAIEEHVFPAREDPESPSPAALPPPTFVPGGADSRHGGEREPTAEARPATPQSAVTVPPTEVTASLLDPLADAAEPEPSAELSPPAQAEPGPSEPVPAEPLATAPAPAEPEPPEPAAPGRPGQEDRGPRGPAPADTGPPDPPPVAHGSGEAEPPAPMAPGRLRPEAG